MCHIDPSQEGVAIEQPCYSYYDSPAVLHKTHVIVSNDGLSGFAVPGGILQVNDVEV